MFFRRRRERRATIERLYGAIVAQSRSPYFYTDLAAPDSLEGRFDFLVLHVYLLFRRLSGEGDAARNLGQAVFDRFCSDMDASLRELGIGDLAVPRHMRNLGEAFYGRAAAYDAALAAEGESELAKALLRNIYGGDAYAMDAAQRLARYVRDAARGLAAQDAAVIASGEVTFPRPEET